MDLVRRVVARYLRALNKRDLPPAFREKWGRFVQRVEGSGDTFEVVVSLPPQMLEDQFGGVPDKQALKREFGRYFTFPSRVPGGISSQLKDIEMQKRGGGMILTITWQEQWGE
jgi:hypothetical protein